MDRKEFDKLIKAETNYIPLGRRNRPESKIQPAFLTIHNTGNTGVGANARAHAAYLNKTGHYVHGGKTIWTSWHFTVDDDRVVQHLPLDEMAYHAHSRANGSSLAIEICMDRGSDQAVANLRAARLVAVLMYDFDLPVGSVRTHHDWTGKACPELLLDGGRPGGTWASFKQTILNEYARIEPAKELPADDGPAQDGAVREPIDPDDDIRCHPVLEMPSRQAPAALRTPSSGMLASGERPVRLETALALGAIGLGIAALWLASRRYEATADVEWLPPFDRPLEPEDDEDSDAPRGPSWRPSDIANQVRRARAQGWDQHFDDAARAFGFSTALLMGIASRETNVQNITGDGGHGRGIMQIDDRYHAGDWTDPRRNIMKGAEILANARDTIERAEGTQQRCRKRPFVGARLGADGLLRTSVAAYNSGCAAYYWMTVSGDPDRGTTGKDYSRDTFARAAEFARHL